MTPRNFFFCTRTKQGITSYIFGTIRYIFNYSACHSCNGIFLSKLYRFLPTNLLIFKTNQQNLSFHLSRTRKCGTAFIIPELHSVYNEKSIISRRFSTSQNESSSKDQSTLRLNDVMDQLSSKKRVIQRFIRTRKHLNFKEELSSKKSVVRKFGKIRKRIFEKRKEHESTGIKARNIIRYRFIYHYQIQTITPAQKKLIRVRTREFKKRLSDIYIREIKRKLATLPKQDVEIVYGIVEKILYKPDLFDKLSILEIRKLVEFFSKRNPSYAIIILEAARDYELGLNNQDYSMMLELYRIVGDHHIGAMHTLEVLKSQGFNPSLEDYLNLLRVLIVKDVSLRQVQSYVEEMISKNYQLDYYVNSLLIDKLIGLNNISAAGELFMNMVAKGQTTHGLILPDIFKQQEGDESSGDLSLHVTIYSVLIQTFINHDHYNKAVEFYWKLLNKYSIPDVQIVELMIFACLVRNDVETAKEFLIHTQTPKMNRVFFHVMDYYIKDKNYRDLFNLYDISLDKKITFTEREYHKLIYSLCLEDCATDAFRIYKDARSKGKLSKDLFIFNKLLKIMIKYERIKEVTLIRKDMEDLKVKPNIETFRNLIQLAAIQHAPEEAETIFREIYRTRLSIDYTTFSCLVKCFADTGELKKAKTALNLMSRSKFQPTINDYNNLIRAAGKLSNYEVKKIGILINNKRLQPNIDTYNCFLESYLTSYFYSVAKRVYKSINKGGFEPNLETFHIIFNHCYVVRGYKEAFEFFYDQLEYKGLNPSVYTWNLLMNKAYESKNPKIIRKIYNELYVRGIKLNNTLLYVKLISFLGFEKEYEEVEDIIDHMRIGRIDEEILMESITEFIKVYIFHEHYDKAESLWKLVQHENLTPSEDLYHSLIKLYTKMKDHDKLRNLRGVIPNNFI